MSAFQEYFDESHQLVRDSVRRFVDREILPHIQLKKPLSAENIQPIESSPRNPISVAKPSYPQALCAFGL